MSFRIGISLDWIARALGIDRRSASGDQPVTVLDTIQPALEAKGWQALDPEFVTAGSAGPTQLVELPNVPDDEMHLFLAVQLEHDAAATEEVAIFYATPDGNSVALQPEVSLATNIHTALDRPILVSPGDHLLGLSQTSIIAGSTFTISGQFVRLAVGEYVPGNPYG